MTWPSYLLADPLAVCLWRRGFTPREICDAIEQVAHRQFDAGMSEADAIIAAIGFIPHDYPSAAQAEAG